MSTVPVAQLCCPTCGRVSIVELRLCAPSAPGTDAQGAHPEPAGTVADARCAADWDREEAS